MREILFRGKRIDNSEWAYGYVFDDGMIDRKMFFVGGLVVSDATGNTDDRYEVGIAFEEVDPATIGQYTGLTDKNGVKVFEGDFIKCTICYDIGCYPTYVSEIKVVKFQNGYFFPFQRSVSDCEVIGNIHDNPDLLTCHDNG